MTIPATPSFFSCSKNYYGDQLVFRMSSLSIFCVLSLFELNRYHGVWTVLMMETLLLYYDTVVAPSPSQNTQYFGSYIKVDI